MQQPAADNSTSWILGVIGKAVALGGLRTTAVQPRRSRSLGRLRSRLLPVQQAGDADPRRRDQSRSGALGSELVDRIELARKTTIGLGMLIVSDYGKLNAADKHVDTDWNLPTNPEVAASCAPPRSSGSARR